MGGVKTVYRLDRATLRRPERTPQGFLRVDGYVGRVGIYEYRNDDGSIRRELRPAEEVFAPRALESLDSAPVTLGHPAELVTATNVRSHEVGTVSGSGRKDGEHVAATIVVKDARAIREVEAGKQELSPGYAIELDETPGTDARYAYAGNPHGRYDAVQRNIIVNHLALVDRARGGSTVRLRMDQAERVDGSGKLTTAVAGHQHLVDLDPQYGSRMSGCTSWAVAEDADSGHEHAWIRNADGSITIAESAGHTHQILDGDAAISSPRPARPDAEIDRSRGSNESGRMDPDEQIRSLMAQLAAAEAKLAPVEDAAKKQQARADALDAKIVTLSQENSDLRSQIAAAATAVETDAIKREKRRADAAEDKIRRFDDGFKAAVAARVALERKAGIVMGPEFRLDDLAERDICATVVKRLDAQADTSAAVTDAFLAGRMESLIELHARNARSQQRVGDLINVEHEKRADSLDEKRRELRDQWKQPLPNDSRARKGA